MKKMRTLNERNQGSEISCRWLQTQLSIFSLLEKSNIYGDIFDGHHNHKCTINWSASRKSWQ